MKRLWKLAWPMMILGSSRVAMRTTDILVVGFLGSWATAAVGLGDVWLRLVLFLGLGFGAGTVARVSQGIGAGNYDQAYSAVTQATLISLGFGLIATVVFWFFGPALIALLGASDRLISEGGLYLKIVGLSAIPRAFYLVSLRGMAGAEDTFNPMLVGFSTTSLNILITVLLVFGWYGFPKLGVLGAAVGTLVGNSLAGLSCLLILLTPSYRLGFSRSGLTDFAEGWKIIKVGVPRVLTGGVVAAGRVPLNGILLWFGDTAVAGFQIALRVLILAMMPNWGISAAAGTYTGQHLGRGEPDRASQQGWTAVRLSFLISLPLTALIVYFRHSVAYLFIREEPTLGIAADFILVYGAVMIMYCVFKNLSGALEGAGDTVVPMLSAMVGVGLVLASASLFSGVFGYGLMAVYLSIVGGYFVRTVMVAGWYEYYSWSDHPAVQTPSSEGGLP
ncbi:MAG: MATE family efflux transporter [bacterium]